MIGAKLEADVHVIYGVRTRLQNTIKCIKQVPLDVANIAVSGFASALAVLTSEHQQLGAVVDRHGRRHDRLHRVQRRDDPTQRRAGGGRRPHYQRRGDRVADPDEPRRDA
jgi:hypothetical protein